MALLSVRGLSMAFVERTLFSDVNFDVEKRDKVGFIGRNGSGKTTLFKIITGELDATSGIAVLAKDSSVGYMQQHVCSHKGRSAYRRACPQD